MDSSLNVLRRRQDLNPLCSYLVTVYKIESYQGVPLSLMSQKVTRLCS